MIKGRSKEEEIDFQIKFNKEKMPFDFPKSFLFCS